MNQTNSSPSPSGSQAARPNAARTTNFTRFAWTLWALVPVGLAAFHFGPGQSAYRKDQAARLVARADEVQRKALDLHATAYEAHLVAIKARLAAFASDDAALRQAALDANAAEEKAYANASAAWGETAQALAEAQALVDELDGPVRDEIRLAKARALVRTGDVASGANELEDLLLDASERETLDSPLAREAREELATAYYYGARLMRLAGKPADEWREVAARAKQNFRYLAESAKSRGEAQQVVENHEKNGELVLDLEQSSLDELFAKPRPKDSPTGKCNGLGQKRGNRPGKRPGDKPGKGAGMDGEIGPGW